MPNDLSHAPAPPCSKSALITRAERWCDRAERLAHASDLTQSAAATALEHLAGLQRDLEAQRQQDGRAHRAALSQAEADIAEQEARLLEARRALSEAGLCADPGEAGDPPPFDRIPHGPAPKSRRFAAISACRALLDLEALRPFLSQDALEQAIAAHAAATGQADLSGVSYACLPKGARIPCALV